MRAHRLVRDVRGASVVEFALVAPAFIFLIVGIMQLGIMFFANAGLNNALAEGARLATIFPRPTSEDIVAEINASDFGLDPDNFAAPAIVYGTSGSSEYAEISLSYTMTPDFIFFTAPAITLRQTRRVFLQPMPGA